MTAKTRKVAISVEVTGATGDVGERVVEIGAVEFTNKEVGGQAWHGYFDPERQLTEEAAARTGLTDEFLHDKPVFSRMASSLVEFLADADLVVYDSARVVPFLDQELVRAGERRLSTASVTDLLVVAGRLHPKANNDFESLCRRYFVNLTQVAMFGAYGTAELLARLSMRISSRRIGRAFAQQDKSAQVVVSSFAEFVNETDGISRTCLCRGVSDKDYLLWPSLFRTDGDKHADLVEQKLMWMFKTHAAGILERVPSSEIEWLTVGQHHGLPTRLLDWSLSPLVAAFFAVESLSAADSAVFLLELGRFKRAEEIDLSALPEIVAFFPSHASRRISAQSGVFTIHPTSTTTLDPTGLKQIVIPAKHKRAFLEKLVKLGIHRATLFPDLDGLSSHLRYLNGF